MKKNRFFILLTSLIFGSFPTYAQYFGVKGGVNVSKMNIENFDYADAIPGIHLGGTMEYPFSDEIVVQTGLLFSMKGTDAVSPGGSVKIRVYYFDIPVNAAYKLEVEDIYILGVTGPVFGIGLSGNWSFADENNSTKEDVEWGADPDDDLKRLDLGWKFGVGVQFLEQFQASLNYTIGMANISPTEQYMRNNVFQISFAYFFEELD